MRCLRPQIQNLRSCRLTLHFHKPIYSSLILKKKIHSCGFLLATSGLLLFWWVYCSSPFPLQHAMITKTNIDPNDSHNFPVLIYLGNTSTEMPSSIDAIMIIIIIVPICLTSSLPSSWDRWSDNGNISEKPSIHTLPPSMQPLDHTDVR